MNGNEFFSMGGYAAFVWPCFALTIAVLVWNVVAAKRLHRQARLQALRRLEQEGERR